MFYTTDANDHGFPHDPFKAIVTPRPIGWIGSIDKNGVANLAPHSYFNAISNNPYFVIFGSITYKDTVRNIEETGDFTCSLVTEDMFDAMNASSVPVEPKIDEFNLIKYSFLVVILLSVSCLFFKASNEGDELKASLKIGNNW